MSIGGYVSNCQGLFLELKATLSRDDVEKLKQDLSGLSIVEWFDFCADNQELVSAFQAASPSQRVKLKKFQIPGLKNRLALAAAQRAKAAYLLLDSILQNQYEGLSYREAGKLAGDVAWGLFQGYPYNYWPFDDDAPKGFRIDSDFGYY